MLPFRYCQKVDQTAVSFGVFLFAYGFPNQPRGLKDEQALFASRVAPNNESCVHRSH